MLEIQKVLKMNRSSILKKFRKRPMARKSVLKRKVPYRWVCEIDMGGGNWMTVYPLSHKKPAYSPTERVKFIHFHGLRNRLGSVGWDIDRHRFFVEGRVQYNLKKLSRRRRSTFRRRAWARNHGYA